MKKILALIAAVLTVLTLSFGLNVASANATAFPNVQIYGESAPCVFSGGQCFIGNHAGWRLDATNDQNWLAFGATGNLAGYVTGTSTNWFTTAPATNNTGYTMELEPNCNIIISGQINSDPIWQALPSLGRMVGPTYTYCRITLNGGQRWSIWHINVDGTTWTRMATFGHS